jgi:hypothetical protein
MVCSRRDLNGRMFMWVEFLSRNFLTCASIGFEWTSLHSSEVFLLFLKYWDFCDGRFSKLVSWKVSQSMNPSRDLVLISFFCCMTWGSCHRHDSLSSCDRSIEDFVFYVMAASLFWRSPFSWNQSPPVFVFKRSCFISVLNWWSVLDWDLRSFGNPFVKYVWPSITVVAEFIALQLMKSFPIVCWILTPGKQWGLLITISYFRDSPLIQISCDSHQFELSNIHNSLNLECRVYMAFSCHDHQGPDILIPWGLSRDFLPQWAWSSFRMSGHLTRDPSEMRLSVPQPQIVQDYWFKLLLSFVDRNGFVSDTRWYRQTQHRKMWKVVEDYFCHKSALVSKAESAQEPEIQCLWTGRGQRSPRIRVPGR